MQTYVKIEFYNTKVDAFLEKCVVELYLTYSPLKASVVERFNRTLNGKLYKFFTLKGNYKWIDKLADKVVEYDQTIKIAPEKINSKISQQLLKTVFSYSGNTNS